MCPQLGKLAGPMAKSFYSGPQACTIFWTVLLHLSRWSARKTKVLLKLIPVQLSFTSAQAKRQSKITPHIEAGILQIFFCLHSKTVPNHWAEPLLKKCLQKHIYEGEIARLSLSLLTMSPNLVEKLCHMFYHLLGGSAMLFMGLLELIRQSNKRGSSKFGMSLPAIIPSVDENT